MNFYYPVDVEGAFTQWCQLHRAEAGNFYVSGQAHYGRVNLENVDPTKIAVAAAESLPQDRRAYIGDEIPEFLRYARPEEAAQLFTPGNKPSPRL